MNDTTILTETTLQWRDIDNLPTEVHTVGDENCKACCCSYPERCEDCGGLTHGEGGAFGYGEHTIRCDRKWCRCFGCPDTSTGTGWPR